MSTQDQPHPPEPGEIVDAEPQPAAAVARVEPAQAAQIAATPPTLQDPMTLGRVLAESGYFKDATGAAQAAVKVMAGRELGFGPIASMTNVHIITTGEGTQNERTTVQIGGALLAAKIQGSDRHRFRVVQRTDRICELAFFEKDPVSGEWVEHREHITFTLADAVRAGLAQKPIWQKWPRKMLFWRCISEGADVYCSDLFGGNSIEVVEEFGGSAALLEDGGADRTTGRVGLPPAPSAPQVIDQAAQAQRPAQAAPAATGERQQATEATITAAQQRKLWAEASKAGIKDDEARIRLLFWWLTDSEHSDRIPKSKVDTVLHAITNHQDVVDEILDLASSGDDRARLALQTFMPDALPPMPETPPETEVVDEAEADRLARESFEGNDGQGKLA